MRARRALLTAFVMIVTLSSAGLTGVPTPVASPAAAAEAGELPAPAFTRYAGADRYGTAAEVVARTFVRGAATAYVATGAAFPDALAAGGVAGAGNSPILLTSPTRLPDDTADELGRLAADEVVILGGAAAVGTDVEAAIADAADAPVRRVQGEDRYDTAASLSAETFSEGVDVAYVATGTNFPDALAGGPRAELAAAPILLVRPDAIPSFTADELTRLEPKSIVVLGGRGAISDAVVDELDAFTDGDVTRLQGADRYLTAVEISKDGFDSASIVYLATGASFPDALGGAPAAIVDGGPILLTRPDCVPQEVANEVERLAPERIVVLGGKAAVSDRAAALLVCGTTEEIPLPSFSVDETLTPDTEELPGLDPGDPARPVGAIADESGNQVDVVEGELIVVAPEEVIDELVNRVDGELIETVPELDPPVHLLRVDPTVFDPEPLPEMVRELDPRARGEITASSDELLGLVAAATELSLDGILIGLNPVPYGTDLRDDLVARNVAEGPTAAFGGYDPDPFTWNYLNETASPMIGVTEAWRALALADRLPATAGDRVPIGILDGGFSSMGNYPPGTTGINDVPNAGSCTGGAPCPWHGTHTAVTAAGVVGDGTAVAGVAGPVATLRLAGWDGDVFSSLRNLGAALSARIINMSFSFEVPGGLGFLVAPIDVVVDLLHADGKMFVASAGNIGYDVDAEDCFIVCWEEAVVVPCELSSVICVGGLASGATTAFGDSNYGRSSVDIWAPWTVYRGADPADPDGNVRMISGTSFSSPYVAGVLALIQAAAPAASVGEVEGHLFATAVAGAGRVRRWVNAYDAVLRALGGNEPPEFSVGSPADGATYTRGQSLVMGATLTDPDSSGATVTWSIDGVEVGTGTSVTVAVRRDNLSLGAHTITARFEDGPYSYDIVRNITVENTPPSVTVTNPDDGYELCQSCSVTLRATSFDPDEPDDRLSSSQLQWRNGASVLGSGPEVLILGSDLGPNGDYTVAVHGTDSNGGTDTDNVLISVVSDPTNFDPEVFITSPPPGERDKFIEDTDATGQYATFDFSGNADDQEDGALPGSSLSWQAFADLDGNGSEESVRNLGSGSSLMDVRLYADCAGPWTDVWRVVLTATDSDGNSGSDEIEVSVTAFC